MGGPYSNMEKFAKQVSEDTWVNKNLLRQILRTIRCKKLAHAAIPWTNLPLKFILCFYN